MVIKDGIHMVHNPKVAKQRAKDGKEVYTADMPVETVDKQGILDDLTGCSIGSVKNVYGAICLVPGKRRSEYEDMTGYSKAVIYATTSALLKLGVIADVNPIGVARFERVADAPLPDGWDMDAILVDSQDRLDNADSYHNRYSKTNVSAGKPTEDSPLCDILANKKSILPQAVSAYQDFLAFIQDAPVRTGELQTIRKALIEFCEYRIAHVSIDCPLCKRGKLERNDHTASCPKCKASVTMGSFDLSVRAMELLAESRRDEE